MGVCWPQVFVPVPVSSLYLGPTFGACVKAWSVYQCIMNAGDTRKEFLKSDRQQELFVKTVMFHLVKTASWKRFKSVSSVVKENVCLSSKA